MVHEEGDITTIREPTSEESQWIVDELQRLVASAGYYLPPDPNAMTDQLPVIARSLYEFLKQGTITEEQFWGSIKAYAASIAEVRVRRMLGSVLAPTAYQIPYHGIAGFAHQWSKHLKNRE